MHESTIFYLMLLSVNYCTLLKYILVCSMFYLCLTVTELIILCLFRNSIYSDMFIKNIDNTVNDLFMRTNNFMADFFQIPTVVGLLCQYNSYCINVCDSQL